MRNMPVYATKEDLLTILADMSALIAADDSFEGSLQYELPWCGWAEAPLKPGEADDPPDGFRVQASYRTGNSRGQGALRMIGELREISE
jgi:hypothetical protein